MNEAVATENNMTETAVGAVEDDVVSVFGSEPIEDIIHNIESSDTIDIQYDTRDIGSESTGSIQGDIEPLAQDTDAEANVTNPTPGTESDETVQDSAPVTNIMQEYLNNMESGVLSNESSVRDEESRFSGAEWYEKVANMDILIAGIGGIGSYASFMLSRTHPFNISLFDMDNVEMSNLSGQLFSTSDIGNNKCLAMRNFIRRYSNTWIVSTFQERFRGQMSKDIMICGFDNMSSRKTFFDTWKNHVRRKSEGRDSCLFIDGRLALEEFQVFAIEGDDEASIRNYESAYLFSDSEAERIPCSMKQTSYMASMIGSVITNLFVNFASNLGEPIATRPVPFLTMYDAKTMRMQFKQE